MSRNLAPSPTRCEARVINSASYNPDHICPNMQSIAVNGKKLCGRHAQKEALAILIGEGRASVLPSVPRQFGSVETMA
jgi:hypothetical protein